MRLTIVTPLGVVVDDDQVSFVRAEDQTGSFGIQPRHASLITALAISVVSWRLRDGTERHGAVRGGVLSVDPDPAGGAVAIATREAIVGPDLVHLQREVLAEFRRVNDEVARARVDEEKLRAVAIRNIVRMLRPSRSARSFGGGA